MGGGSGFSTFFSRVQKTQVPVLMVGGGGQNLKTQNPVYPPTYESKPIPDAMFTFSKNKLQPVALCAQK